MNTRNQNPEDSSAAVSPRDLATAGLNSMAYIRPMTEKGMQFFAIHAADGTQLSVVESRDLAEAAVRQHDMEPVSVH